MKNMFSWLSSWAATLRSRFFEKETGRFLRDEGFHPEDYEEVGEP